MGTPSALQHDTTLPTTLTCTFCMQVHGQGELRSRPVSSPGVSSLTPLSRIKPLPPLIQRGDRVLTTPACRVYAEHGARRLSRTQRPSASWRAHLWYSPYLPCLALNADLGCLLSFTATSGYGREVYICIHSQDPPVAPPARRQP
jgi:hypothetical protein